MAINDAAREAAQGEAMNIPADDLVPVFHKPLSKKQLGALFAQGARAPTISPLKVAKILNTMKIPHVFVGGIIVGCWTGFPRATEDVDAVLDNGARVEDIKKAMLKMQKGLKATIHPSVMRFDGKTPIGRKNLLDFIIPYHGLYSHVNEYVVTLSVGGVVVRIPTPEMLVALKYAAAATSLIRDKRKQAQDWVDLESVVHAQPNLKLKVVEKLVEYIGPGLGKDIIKRIKKIRS